MEIAITLYALAALLAGTAFLLRPLLHILLLPVVLVYKMVTNEGGARKKLLLPFFVLLFTACVAAFITWHQQQ